MLLETVKCLRERIDRHESLRRADKEAEAFRDRTGTLEDTQRDLVTAMAKLGVLCRNGLHPSKLPDATTALSASHDYVAELSAGSSAGGTFSQFKRSTEKVAKDVGTALTELLETVAGNLPVFDETFLRQVELIPTYTDQVALIRRERDALFANGDLASLPPAKLDAFLKRRDDLRRLADLLDPADFPKEVLDFFKATRQLEGAPIEKFTDTVRDWLQGRNLLKNVRVRVVSRR